MSYNSYVINIVQYFLRGEVAQPIILMPVKDVELLNWCQSVGFAETPSKTIVSEELQCQKNAIPCQRPNDQTIAKENPN